MRGWLAFATVWTWYTYVLMFLGGLLLLAAAMMTGDVYQAVEGVAVVTWMVARYFLPSDWKLGAIVLACAVTGFYSMWHAMPVPEVIKAGGILSLGVGLLVLWAVVAPRLPETAESQKD